MTVSGICSNDTYVESRLTADQVKRYGFSWCRSIVYTGANSRNMVIGAARNRQPFCKTLVVFNTESTGLGVEDVDGMAQQLDEFLEEAHGAIAAIEPGNELDTPEWNISDDLVIRIGRKAAEVCHRHGVLCLAPSLIGDPAAGHFETWAKGLVGHVDAMAAHPYYCSVEGQPSRPDLHFNGEPNKWRFGTVEEKADICASLSQGLPTWFTEAGCPTVFDGITPQEQALWTRGFQRFQHPAIPVVMQFCLTDAMAPSAELDDQKYWGITTADGTEKVSAVMLDQMQPKEEPQPEPEPEPEPTPMPRTDDEAIEECRKAIWNAMNPAVPYDPANLAICHYWTEHIDEMGSPCGPELAGADNAYMPFTRGVWRWLNDGQNTIEKVA